MILTKKKFDFGLINTLWVSGNSINNQLLDEVNSIIQLMQHLTEIYLYSKNCEYNCQIHTNKKYLKKIQYYYVADFQHLIKLPKKIIDTTGNKTSLFIIQNTYNLAKVLFGKCKFSKSFRELLLSEEHNHVLQLLIAEKRDVDVLCDVLSSLLNYKVEKVKLLLSESFRFCNDKSYHEYFAKIGRIYLFAKKIYGKKTEVELSDPLSFIFDVSLENTQKCCHFRTKANILELNCKGILRWCDIIIGPVNQITKKDFNKSWEEWINSFKNKQQPLICNKCTFEKLCNSQISQFKLHNEYFDPLCPNTFNFKSLGHYTKMIDNILSDLSLEKAKDPDELYFFLKQFKKTEHFSRNNSNFDNQVRWGHNWTLTDDFSMIGEMGWRHAELVIEWLRSKVLNENMEGCNILNIGPWTGGETYLLSKLGSHIDVYEESSLYRNTIKYISQQYNLDIDVKGKSLYELASERNEIYDYVYFSGIISHLTDIIVGLRTIFNQLKNGGFLLLETQTSYNDDGTTEFWGPHRKGWIWFNISRSTLLESLRSVGFKNIRIVRIYDNRRILVVAMKKNWENLKLRMGLSFPNIP